jgi:hypothetical protein
MRTEDHNMWGSAKEDFELSTLPWLLANGKEVGEQSQQGDENAKDIIQHYKMLYRSFDPVTHILLKEAIEEYILAHK